jgi:DNA-binding response OmpR family regulator
VTPETAAPATVLIVDDDEETIATYARVLRLDGYTVHTALSAEAGLREIDQFAPDAIILDLHMPDVDGLEFLRRLRARATEHVIPVVMVTGDYYVADDVAGELKSLSAELRLKPLWFDDLTSLVRTLTTSHT